MSDYLGGGSTAPMEMGGFPVNVDRSFSSLGQVEQNFWLSGMQAGLTGDGAIEPDAIEGPSAGGYGDTPIENIWDISKSIFDAAKDIAGKLWPAVGIGLETGERLLDMVDGSGAMGYGDGSMVRYGPWGPVRAVSRLQSVQENGRELTDTEFAAKYGYYPGSGRRGYRRYRGYGSAGRRGTRSGFGGRPYRRRY